MGDWRCDSSGLPGVLVGLLKKESYKAISRAQLATFARRWLYEQRLLIPGKRQVDDLVRRAILQAEHDMFRAVEAAVPEPIRAHWVAELGTMHSKKKSVLEWLQDSPGKPSRQTLDEQLDCIEYLKRIAVQEYPLDAIRLERQRQYALRIRRRRPTRWQALKDPRRTLEAVCFLRMMLLQTTDIAIALAERDILKLRRDTLERVKTVNAELGVTLKKRVHTLQAFARVETRTADELRLGIFELLPEQEVPTFPSQAAEARYRMTDDARQVRRLVRAMLLLDFEAAPGNRLIDAVAALRGFHRRKVRHLPRDVDGSFAPLWSATIDGDDRKRALRAFETAVLFELRKGLRNGSVWVPYSLSYRNRDELLIPSKEWAMTRKRYYSRLKLPQEPAVFVAKYTKLLESGLERVAQAVRAGTVDVENGKLELRKLEAEETSPAVEQVRDALFREVGTVQFPELIMETDSHIRFSSALLGCEPKSRRELLTLYGALLAHGTDMTATAVSLMMPAISAAAISECMQLLEQGTGLREANDESVAFIRRHAVTKSWGEGTIASADSMSLDATRHLFSARVDPRRKRHGVGVYTHKLDQWPLIYDQPIVLLQRQSGAAIEGMVRQRAAGEVERVAVDTHGFTSFGMGVAKALGFDLCPRLKGLRQRRLHIPRGVRVPSILKPVVVYDVSMNHIDGGWDEFVRVVASIEGGWLSSVLALERFGAASRADPIHKCGTALGRLLLTLFLCDFVGNETFRRELLRLLGHGEATHRLLRAIHYGSIVAARGRRREELSAISGSLTLLSNLTMAWMTKHMQRVLDTWRREGDPKIDPAIQRHIGPAHFEGINFRGTFDFPMHRYGERLLRRWK